MKKIIGFLVVFIVLVSCTNDDSEPQNTTVTIKFTHNWDGVPVNSSDFNSFKFINKNGDLISINRLRYVLSNISLGLQTSNYQLINVGENAGLELKVDDVSIGPQALKFTFGFRDADNKDGVYQDLNIVNFNVPGPAASVNLGGGYHYMQFDGKYKDTNNQDASFNYHAIRAADRTNTNDPWENLPDTSFVVDLGNIEIDNTTTIEIKMNIAEWFKNPNTWNLNELNTVLMPNFEAQKLMSANGKTVFSLGEMN